MNANQTSSLDFESSLQVSNNSAPKKRKTDVNCSKCGEAGHNRRRCPQLRDKKAERKYTCQYCGAEGKKLLPRIFGARESIIRFDRVVEAKERATSLDR